VVGALQFLAIAAGSVAGYSFFKGCGVLQIVLGLVVVAIGVLGFSIVSALKERRTFTLSGPEQPVHAFRASTHLPKESSISFRCHATSVP
jgi:hypothetical protein